MSGQVVGTLSSGPASTQGWGVRLRTCAQRWVCHPDRLDLSLSSSHGRPGGFPPLSWDMKGFSAPWPSWGQRACSARGTKLRSGCSPCPVAADTTRGAERVESSTSPAHPHHTHSHTMYKHTHTSIPHTHTHHTHTTHIHTTYHTHTTHTHIHTMPTHTSIPCTHFCIFCIYDAPPICARNRSEPLSIFLRTRKSRTGKKYVKGQCRGKGVRGPKLEESTG